MNMIQIEKVIMNKMRLKNNNYNKNPNFNFFQINQEL